jgi:hypothetical protein
LTSINIDSFRPADQSATQIKVLHFPHPHADASDRSQQKTKVSVQYLIEPALVVASSSTAIDVVSAKFTLDPPAQLVPSAWHQQQQQQVIDVTAHA